MFGPLHEGQVQHVGNTPTFNLLPPVVDGFLGRAESMHAVISLLSEHNIVTIKGLPGIGKTSLAKAVGNFLLDRNCFRDGVIYLSLRGCESLEMLVKRVAVQVLKKTLKEEAIPLNATESQGGHFEDALELCHTNLRDKHALLILDNCEEIMIQDETGFKDFVSGFFAQYTAKVRLLLTSRTTLGAIEGINENVYQLRELSRR